MCKNVPRTAPSARTNPVQAGRASAVQSRGRPTFNVKTVKRPPKKPVVYFVQAETGAIKIGTTGNIEWRMQTLRGQSPVPLVLLATVRGGRTEEFEYHRQFAHARLHGEWFERCPEIEAEIARLENAA